MYILVGTMSQIHRFSFKEHYHSGVAGWRLTCKLFLRDCCSFPPWECAHSCLVAPLMLTWTQHQAVRREAAVGRIYLTNPYLFIFPSTYQININKKRWRSHMGTRHLWASHPVQGEHFLRRSLFLVWRLRSTLSRPEDATHSFTGAHWRFCSPPAYGMIISFLIPSLI